MHSFILYAVQNTTKERTGGGVEYFSAGTGADVTKVADCAIHLRNNLTLLGES